MCLLADEEEGCLSYYRRAMQAKPGLEPLLLEYGVRRLAGLVITEKKACFDFVAEGVSRTPYPFGERFILE